MEAHKNTKKSLPEDEIKKRPNPTSLLTSSMYVSMQNDTPSVYWSLINYYFHF